MESAYTTKSSIIIFKSPTCSSIVKIALVKVGFFMRRIKMNATDKKNKKAQPESLNVLDQPMICQLTGGRDSK
jgi:hypothetical protein